MNLTIGNTRISSPKQIKGQYIAAACGLALALSAVAVYAPWNNGSSTTKAPGTAVGSSTHDAGQTPSIVYYLVGSQQEAALFDAVLSSEGATLDPTGVRTTTLVVDTAQAESLFAETARELMLVGTSFHIVDLRIVDLRAQPAASAAPALREGAVPDRSKLDQDILASVISTERATWVFSDSVE